MTDELVKRLRAARESGDPWAAWHLAFQAADCIEQLEIEKNRSYRNLTHAMTHIDKLEAALRKYAEEEYNGYNADGAHARKALEGKDD